MTYIIGWKSKDSVFLTSDSVITHSGISNTTGQITSFGESYNAEGKMIREDTNKILIINDSLCITFSGDVEIAKEILRIVSLIIGKAKVNQNKITDAFEKALIAIRPINDNKIPSFIIAAIVESESLLCSFNVTKKIGLETHKYLVQTGSINNLYKSITIEYFKEQISHSMTDETRLVVFNSLIQIYGVHENLLKQYVGGTISGLFLNKKGVFWQEDTCYVIYSIKNQSINNPMLIRMIVRDNVIITHSPFNSRTSAFFDISTDIVPNDFENNWESQWKHQLNSFNFKYVVFLAKEYRKVTIVKNIEEDLKGKF
ncbi:MAG: hypothetical protein IMY67_10780, partial [Bacteroidetes bacterium]|nr:hypothetical protein [Bacteroidota bacterium]